MNRSFFLRCTKMYAPVPSGTGGRKRERAGSANRRSQQGEGMCLIKSGKLGGCDAMNGIVSKNRNRSVHDARGETGWAKRTDVISRILTCGGAGLVSRFRGSKRCRPRFAGGRAGSDRLGGMGFADRSFRDGHKYLDHQNPEDGSPENRSSEHFRDCNVPNPGRSTEIQY